MSLLYPGFEKRPFVMLVMPPDIFPLILLIDVLDLLGDAGALGLGPAKKNFVLEYDNDVMYDNIIEKYFSKLEKTIEIKYHNTLLLNLKFFPCYCTNL